MLGSHFDLAKEIATIAAKRGTEDPARHEPDGETTKAYADFDKKVRDFVEMIAPTSSHGGGPIISPYSDDD